MPAMTPDTPLAYDSEEVGEAFTEWCAARNIEARDDQEYRWLRQAFTAGMNEVARYAEPAPRIARVSTDVPADSLRAFADMAGETYRQDHPAALGITAVRNIARYAPAGKRVRLWIEWEAHAASDPGPGSVAAIPGRPYRHYDGQPDSHLRSECSVERCGLMPHHAADPR